MWHGFSTYSLQRVDIHKFTASEIEFLRAGVSGRPSMQSRCIWGEAKDCINLTLWSLTQGRELVWASMAASHCWGASGHSP